MLRNHPNVSFKLFGMYKHPKESTLVYITLKVFQPNAYL